ncbi:HD domain-containing phosphohydrolase [Halomonas sp. WWR20]
MSPTEVKHPGELLSLLEALCQPGGASLCFEEESGVLWPALLMDISPGERLIIDITATPEIAQRLKAGAEFSLIGQAHGAMVRTATLVAGERIDAPSRVQFRCAYPQSANVVHRRNAFRAELKPGMQVRADLFLPTQAEAIRGELKNLSLGGCMLEVSLAHAVLLKNARHPARLTAHFPNGQSLEAQAHIRHVRTNNEWTTALAGCEFVGATPSVERLVWYFVKEIERESARNALAGSKALSPSALFQSANDASSKTAAEASGSAAPLAGGAMTKRLAKVAAYLNAQLLQLQAGAAIEPALLSRQSDALLALLQQDREALLYATVCLPHQPVLIQHSLAVAVRLADLGQARRLAPDVLKALIACALVHDLGKALLPEALVASPTPFSAEQRAELQKHVALLLARLETCRWLAPEVVTAVIGMGNERLDGSGYPRAAQGEQLSELARMMAVVDVADAMARKRADRSAWSLMDIYRHLLGAPGQFDNAWVQRYIKRFGTAPIGSLAKYSSGTLAWVQRLDIRGQPAQVRAVMNVNNRARRFDQRLDEGQIGQLGRLEGVVDAHEFGLAPV